MAPLEDAPINVPGGCVSGIAGNRFVRRWTVSECMCGSSTCKQCNPRRAGGEIEPIKTWDDLLAIEMAARALSKKLDVVTKETNSIFVLAAIRGCEYKGPTFEAEKKALDVLLG